LFCKARVKIISNWVAPSVVHKYNFLNIQAMTRVSRQKKLTYEYAKSETVSPSLSFITSTSLVCIALEVYVLYSVFGVSERSEVGWLLDWFFLLTKLSVITLCTALIGFTAYCWYKFIINRNFNSTEALSQANQIVDSEFAQWRKACPRAVLHNSPKTKRTVGCCNVYKLSTRSELRFQSDVNAFLEKYASAELYDMLLTKKTNTIQIRFCAVRKAKPQGSYKSISQ
jgi:hypothetical protein